MHLIALETASPESRYSQLDCLNIFRKSKVRDRLKKRSVNLMEKVLSRDNGISTRGFCYPEVDTIFDADPQQLNSVFEMTGPRLGAEALGKALKSARISASELDSLIVCTCTGYLCPGLSSYIGELTGLKSSCELLDVVGMGCGAAVPSLRQAHYQLASQQHLKVAVIAVEVCSAAFYLDDDPGVIISACLFGDGAAASIWAGGPAPSGSWATRSFDSTFLPEKRNLLRFENARGFLRNRLSRAVPEAAAQAVKCLYERAPGNGFNPDPTGILPHTGGREVLDALEAHLPGTSFPSSRCILDRHGNTSSSSVLFVLHHYLKDSVPPRNALWLTSFGAGFSAYSFGLTKAL